MPDTPAECKPELTEPSEAPGLPGLRSWWAVYLLVVFAFITWVVLLYALGRAYT